VFPASPSPGTADRRSPLPPSPCTADRRSQGDWRLSEAKSRSIGSRGRGPFALLVNCSTALLFSEDGGERSSAFFPPICDCPGYHCVPPLSHLPRRQNRDSVHGTSPCSSVHQNECENSSEKQGISCHGGHVVDMTSPPSGTNCHRTAKTDSELATRIAAWAKLPEPIRAGIIAMVNAVT
jgi:hypothetical protein